MRTVSKALEILDLFGKGRSEMRSTDVARALDLDRSTCHRMLKVLSKHGYLTKDNHSKKYTLGPTVLRLAHVREAITPTVEVYEQILKDLTDLTGETSHASLIAGEQIASVAMCDGLKSNRVHHEIGGQMEWHATASGLACLAYSPPILRDSVLDKPLRRFSANTLTTRDLILKELEVVRTRGYSKANGSFDPEVTGIAVPILGSGQISKGAISVVVPSSRMTPELERVIATHIQHAAEKATRFELGTAVAHFKPKLGVAS